PSKLSEDEIKKLKEVYEENVEKGRFTVQIENLSETDLPVMITQNEFMRRYQDMERMSGQKQMFGGFENYNLIVNANHPLVQTILTTEDDDKKKEVAEQLIDIALLSQNLLKGDKLTDFLKRSVEFVKR
ncbi:MAG: molecular chaperone HtpG, partial [Bacteroidales bacterium]|nr:molecular chaperone HtpG [Bacteroidales bacterium]